MAWEPNVVALLVLCSGLVATAVGLAVLRERPDPMADLIVAFMAAVAGWSFCHGIMYGLQDADRVAFFGRLAVVPGTLAPVPFLFIALRMRGVDRWQTPLSYGLVAAPGVLLGALALTDPLHGLFWGPYSLETVYGASVVTADPGPLYWLVFAYPYGLTLVGLGVLGRVVLEAGPLYRKQALLLFVGALAPLATSVAFVLGLMPGEPVDLTAVALTVSGATFALAEFYLDLVDLRPVARQELIASLDDAIVVVGTGDRVRDANPTAERVFDGLEVDAPVSAVLPEPALEDGAELTATADGGRRVFRTRTTPLRDDAGERVGRILHLQDVTEVVEREQRVSVLNRVLRHNVRNELTVALGHIELLDGTDPDPEHVATARDSLERVVAFAEKARSIEQTLQHSDSAAVVAVDPVVDSVLAAAHDRFPDATIRRRPADDQGATVEVCDELLLERSLWELVENGVVHSEREAPTVTVEVHATSDRVLVRVSDDGPGVPAAEQEILKEQPESALRHGSGLGLWLVQWTASLSAGEVHFEDGGSTVVLALPAADPGAGEGNEGSATAAESAADD